MDLTKQEASKSKYLSVCVVVSRVFLLFVLKYKIILFVSIKMVFKIKMSLFSNVFQMNFILTF